MSRGSISGASCFALAPSSWAGLSSGFPLARRCATRHVGAEARTRRSYRARPLMALPEMEKESCKVLVVGSGGREHALVDAIHASPYVAEVLAAPGNVGMDGSCRRITDVSATDVEKLVALAKKEDVSLVVVGPEAPLVDGIVDRLRAEGINAFGPNANAAILEGSKAFTKDFLTRHDIPTAWYGRFTDASEAKAFIREKGAPIVVKADGLAAGKGVIIANTVDEACNAVDAILVDRRFGDAGAELIVEEFLEGEEVSFFAVIDGTEAVPLASAQDHKAAYEGDTGPNTGGMGAYSPAPVCDEKLKEQIMSRVVLPTMQGMAAEGRTFRGVLYCGMMVDSKTGEAKVLECKLRSGLPCRNCLRRKAVTGHLGPTHWTSPSHGMAVLMSPCERSVAMRVDLTRHVLEFGRLTVTDNVRFGDPECQVLCKRLKTDMFELLYRASCDRLGEDGFAVEWHPFASVVVVVAAKGYPGAYSKGTVIREIAAANELDGVSVYHAGTARSPDGEIVAAGGRVLGVTATGESILAAQRRAYAGVDAIDWEDGFCRRDIGWRAIEREQENVAATIFP